MAQDNGHGCHLAIRRMNRCQRAISERPLFADFCHILLTSCSVAYSEFKFFRIFFAHGSLISECRGIASTTPVFGLIHREWVAPSHFI